MIDFMLFGSFDLSQMNGRTDICTFRVAFATEKSQNSIDMTKFAS